ncbi:MAG: hypothetical protein HOG70_03815 [Elusimicrobiaceae bacterium]|nr:hypothetical protein [Elusimicrobiaceae bacterium]
MKKHIEKLKTADWNFHIKLLVIIYIGPVLMFFGFKFFTSKLEKPYHKREIPSEFKPWQN